MTESAHTTEKLSFIVIGLLCGACIALLLAWLTSVLIQSSEQRLDESDRAQFLDFVRVKRSEQVQRKNIKPKRPTHNQAPEVPQMAQTAQNNMADGQAVAVSALADSVATDISVGDNDFGAGIATGDGEYLPIVKVAPVYPINALQRKIEGYCVVRYSVTTSGSVRDVSVVEGHCTHDMFKSVSVDAALRFKYKPRVVNGEAIEVHGVHNRFIFKMDKQQRQ